ncbi:MAG: VacJ family lipoprotein [Gammaproteobacteria bacterium]|nr:VacJ family lipoprotein [Gammaproteobacteria bacterium]
MTPKARTFVLKQVTVLALIAALISGCASNTVNDDSPVYDPFEPVNRGIYQFNTVADKYVLRPVAKGYQDFIPDFIRTGINNFFNNLSYPVTIFNGLLQGKFAQAGSDTGRFLINTTLGLAGFLDPATSANIPVHNEDFGQTLGTWGVPEGPYLVVPFFGPKTARSVSGNVFDIYLTNPQFQVFSSSVQTKVNILWYIHTRSTLLAFDDEINKAYDPYTFVRDAYVQNRNYLLYDGNPPEEAFFDEENFDDEEFNEDF